MKSKVRIKRVYEKPEKSDGCRILVDRLWPRGLSREKARVDVWLRGIAPGDELRKWFNHDPAKWTEFQRRYKQELAANKEAVAELRALIHSEPVITLLYSASDENHNNAVALKNLWLLPQNELSR